MVEADDITPSSRTTIALYALFVVLELLALSLGGCARTSPAEAVHGARSALVAVDIAAETQAPAVVEARRLRIEQCRARDLPTHEERQACMGPLAEPLAPTAQDASAAYDAAVKALEELETMLEALERMKKAAKDVEAGRAP